MKIISDKRLLISGVLATCIVVIFCCIGIVSIHMYDRATAEAKLGSKFLFSFSGVFVCLMSLHHMSTWYISYWFFESQIRMRRGVNQKFAEYDAKLFAYSQLFSDNSLSLPFSVSKFWVLSQHPIPSAKHCSISSLRDKPGTVVIRLSKKNCKKLRALLLTYPSAPYASAVQRALQSVVF